MTFNHAFYPASYKLTRNEVLSKVNNYLEARARDNVMTSELIEKREEVLRLYHYELLIAQSKIETWEELMNDPELSFRRRLCAKLYNLSGVDIGIELGRTSEAISNLFNENIMPQWPRPFQLTVLFDHPWQLVNKVKPDKYSFLESPEFFENGVADRIEIWNLMDEKAKVKSIRGYVITNPAEVFPQESVAVTGRWVTTYLEFDYFEFHLNNEPLIDNRVRKGILKIFPSARHVLTTYRPFKPTHKRSLWVIIPKNNKLGSYQGMLHELKEYREKTEFHSLT